MGLRTALEDLNGRLRQLDDAVAALHVTVTEDRPALGESALVDRVENHVSDVLGLVEGALQHAEAASEAFDAARGAAAIAHLFRAHELLNQAASRHYGELASHDALVELLRMGRERGPQWLAWSRVTKSAVESSASLVLETQRALAESWQEAAERLLVQSGGGPSLARKNPDIEKKETENAPKQ
jgi:hypothetical protein